MRLLILLGPVLAGMISVANCAEVTRSPITEIKDRSWLSANDVEAYSGTYQDPETPESHGSYMAPGPWLKSWNVIAPEGETIEHTPYRFAVRVPPGYGAPEKKWPVLLVLADRPESETVRSILERAKDFIVVVPAKPIGELWQSDGLKTCLDVVLERYRTDLDRVSVTGYGTAGGAVWDLVCRYPGMFAAAVPVSAVAPLSGGSYHNRENRIAKVPVWMFHGGKDWTVPVESARRQERMLTAAGGHVRLTVYPALGHAVMQSVYAAPQVYDWLRQQSRAAPQVLADVAEPPAQGAPTVEIAQWFQGRSAAVSLTFDDGPESHATVAAPLLEEFGVRGTFFVMPEGVAGRGAVSWDQLRAMAARGHEIADHIHGYAPAAGDWEKQMQASRDWIDREIPGQRCLTHAYGGCDFNATRAAAKVFIAARRCVGLEHAEPGDLYAAKGRLVDGVTREQFADMLTDAIQYRGWFTTGLHATPTPDVLKGMLEAIQSKRNDLWVAPYRDVVKYIRERRFTEIAVTSRENEIRIAASSPLPVDIYNQLLTLAVPLPEKHGTVSVMQNGRAVRAEIRDDGRVVLCDVTPGGGEIVVRF